MFQGIGKMLLLMGIFLVAIGLFLVFFEKIPFLGKLPGDIIVRKKNFVFYFPIVTSLLLSAILSLILFIISKLR